MSWFKFESLRRIIVRSLEKLIRLFRFKSFKVKFKVPYLAEVEGTWEPDHTEQEAAWEMYVELVTRVPIVPLDPSEGILREALTSMYSLFDTTRKILRQKGPQIAQPKGEGNLSFGFVAVAILNKVLRPILAKWHPMLQEYESKRPGTVSIADHEQQWEYYAELRQVIDDVREPLVEYANLLAKVAGVPSLLETDAAEEA